MPGEENIAYDTSGAVKITKLEISPKRQIAYIATEYLGAANLQAVIYLKRFQKYCFSGDLGAATDFKVDKSRSSGGMYGIVVTSSSGEDKFRRNFSFDGRSKKYKLFSCQVRKEEKGWRKCAASEE